MKYLLNTYYVSDTVLGDVLSKIKKMVCTSTGLTVSPMQYLFKNVERSLKRDSKY